jgi:predicted nucleic acid-binding protein
LVLADNIELLPKLFGQVLAPQAVHDELADREAPAVVRAWIAQAPAWLDVRPNPDIGVGVYGTGPKLDRGERAVIALAHEVRADLVLMDDRDGVTVARSEGFAASGTLGVLDLAARRGLVDFVVACGRLKETSFYYPQGLVDALLAQHSKGDGE